MYDIDMYESELEELDQTMHLRSLGDQITRKLIVGSQMCWPYKNTQANILLFSDGSQEKILVADESDEENQVLNELSREELDKTYGVDVYGKLRSYPQLFLKKEAFLVYSLNKFPQTLDWLRENPAIMSEISGDVENLSQTDFLKMGDDGKWSILPGNLMDKPRIPCYVKMGEDGKLRMLKEPVVADSKQETFTLKNPGVDNNYESRWWPNKRTRSKKEDVLLDMKGWKYEAPGILAASKIASIQGDKLGSEDLGKILKEFAQGVADFPDVCLPTASRVLRSKIYELCPDLRGELEYQKDGCLLSTIATLTIGNEIKSGADMSNSRLNLVANGMTGHYSGTEEDDKKKFKLYLIGKVDNFARPVPIKKN